MPDNEKNSDSSDSESAVTAVQDGHFWSPRKLRQFFWDNPLWRGLIRRRFPDFSPGFGERLLDDMINNFCDKLQSTCPRKVEGFIAIQFVTREPEFCRTLIKPGKEAVQILFDADREHYVVVHLHYPEGKPQLVVYDPLLNQDSVRSPEQLESYVPYSLLLQLVGIFAHIDFGLQFKILPVYFQRDIEPQNDSWSCGYRAIGTVMDLLLNRDPRKSYYEIRNIYSFFHWVNENKPTWSHFENANVRRDKPMNQARFMCVAITNDLMKSKGLARVARPITDANNNESQAASAKSPSSPSETSSDTQATSPNTPPPRTPNCTAASGSSKKSTGSESGSRTGTSRSCSTSSVSSNVTTASTTTKTVSSVSSARVAKRCHAGRDDDEEEEHLRSHPRLEVSFCSKYDELRLKAETPPTSESLKLELEELVESEFVRRS